MKIIFMGTPDFAVPSLVALYNAGLEIKAVITQPDRPRGRGQMKKFSAIKAKALELGLDIYQPERIKDAKFVGILKDLNPDIIVVVAFGQILSEAILNIPSFGCINVHASLLPKYRGAAPIHWAIIRGEGETGITTMFMDKGLDTGAMLLKRKIKIDQEINMGQLHDHLALLGGELLIETINQLRAGTLKPESQKEKEASYAPLLTAEHEIIDWDKEQINIHNLIRGLNPWPGAYTYYQTRRIKIWGSVIKEMNDYPKLKPGTILGVDEQGLWIQTKDTPLLITNVQPQGKKSMNARDFYHGYRLKLGKMLGDLNAN